MIRGAAWAVGMRWGVRLIGLASTVILARLLMPADFGIVAMGALTIGFLSTFLELGITMLVIREHQPSREHYDTAWTISLLQGFFLTGLLLAFAPLAGRYLD